MSAQPMINSCNCNETIEREIWTRSYLRALDVASPEAAAAVADNAVALFEARWQHGAKSEEEIRRSNSVIAARLANGIRLTDFTAD